MDHLNSSHYSPTSRQNWSHLIFHHQQIHRGACLDKYHPLLTFTFSRAKNLQIIWIQIFSHFLNFLNSENLKKNSDFSQIIRSASLRVCDRGEERQAVLVQSKSQFLFLLFFFFPTAPYRIIVPWPSTKPMAPALGELSLSHQTTREILLFLLPDTVNNETNILIQPSWRVSLIFCLRISFIYDRVVSKA